MFTAEERAIYSPALPSGRVFGHFDPLAVRRELLLLTSGRLNDLLDAYENPPEDDPLARLKAEKAIAAASRGAFGFPPVTDKGGVLDAEAIEVLYDFLDYLGKGRAAADGSPNTSPSVAPAG